MLRRFAWPIAIAVLLVALAGGFFAGRASEGEKTVTVNSSGASPAEIEAAKAGKIVGHVRSSDVVKVFPPQILTDGDVAKEKQGTPQRAFLEWWQAFQFHDAAKVESLTSQETLNAIGPDNLATIVHTLGLPGVEILGTSSGGSTATISAGLLTFTPPHPGAPPPRKPTHSDPTSFLMKNQNGKWLFDQTDFLQLKLHAIRSR